MVESTISSGAELKLPDAVLKVGVTAWIDNFLQLAGTNPAILSPSPLFILDGTYAGLSIVYKASPHGREVKFTETYYANGRDERHTKTIAVTVEAGHNASITAWEHVVGRVKTSHSDSNEAFTHAYRLLEKYKVKEV